jgi:hypothetical protein
MINVITIASNGLKHEMIEKMFLPVNLVTWILQHAFRISDGARIIYPLTPPKNLRDIGLKLATAVSLHISPINVTEYSNAQAQLLAVTWRISQTQIRP